MKKGTELVVLEDIPPILAHKITYYNDPTFIDRLKSVSKSLASLGSKLPSQKQLESAVQSGELGAPVPRINLEAHSALVDATSARNITALPDVTSIIEKPFTAENALNLDSLALKDFAVDFSGVPAVAPSDDLNIEELDAYVSALCKEAGIAA